MGNNHSGTYVGHRLKKSVHYKTDCPAPPGKPDIVPLGWAEDGVTLRWKPPRYDGGSPLTGYQVECNRLGSSVWVRTSPPLVVRPELLLTGLEPGFQYQFRVSACNAAGVSIPGEISDILTVSIDKAPISAPKFVSQLEDTIVVEGEKVEFRTFFEGSPLPTISWFKDGYEIFSSRRTAIITEGNCSTLIFHQTSLSDEGEIKCTATNRAGHAACKTRLSLEAAPRVRLPRNYEEGLLYETDETIFLKVSVAGKPTPEIEWRHNGQIIEPSSRIEISTTERFSTLRIENASREDRGEYQINAINCIGEDYASFLVTITARPNPPESVAVVQNPDKSVSLSWVSPNDDGGCQIGNYVIEYYRTGWNVWLKAATSRKLTATLFDLIEGSEYRFRVKAESPYGMSEPSTETRPIFIPGKSSELKFNAMDIDFEQKTMNITHNDLPQVIPRRKRNISPKLDEIENQYDNENANKYTLEIPTGVSLRKQRIIEKKESSDFNPNNILRETNKLSNFNQKDIFNSEKMNTGSSEFMLVLYPENDKDNREKRKSFQLDLEEAMCPPPLSLSAPDLGYDFIPIRPLRHSVSSTELLHEQAMNRFYQVVAMKEAKQETNNIQPVAKENLPEIKINIIRDDSIAEETDKNEQKPKINGKDNITPERSTNELLVSNESLSKDKVDDNGSIYEEDYTASTVSTGDSEISDSDSLGDDIDRLRSRIEENTTYHPKEMAIKPARAVEVLTKPAPLPDPNFVPKPILKKRETDIIPRTSPQKEIPIPAPEEKQPEKLDKAPKQKQTDKFLNKVPLFKKFAKFPVEKGVFSDKKSKNKSKTEEQAIAPVKKTENMDNEVQDEGRCVIELYGDIVKEYGQNKKPPLKLYTNTEELKKAAENQKNVNTNNAIIVSNNTRQIRPKPPVQNKTPAKPVVAPATTVKKTVPEKKPIVKQKLQPQQSRQKSPVPVSKKEVEIEKVSVSKSFSEINAEAENNVKTAFNYVIDIFILCVAFWLYLFKDERLAIPFLFLAVYRQVHNAIKDKIPLWLKNKIMSGD